MHILPITGWSGHLCTNKEALQGQAAFGRCEANAEKRRTFNLTSHCEFLVLFELCKGVAL